VWWDGGDKHIRGPSSMRFLRSLVCMREESIGCVFGKLLHLLTNYFIFEKSSDHAVLRTRSSCGTDMIATEDIW
jgi:hypothetical protein